MPTIEKKPLPPIGSGSVTINPSDKEDITSRARDVIDHYMSGKGSWWNEGPRKSAQQTVDDLKRFKDSVLTSEQYIDDPGSVLTSVKEMIDAAIEQAGQAIPNLENNGPGEIRPGDPREFDQPRHSANPRSTNKWQSGDTCSADQPRPARAHWYNSVEPASRLTGDPCSAQCR
ncbi:hypothetical protein [Bradyrhizobium betae]|uniref:hypothetical protein n=1 Tax=Bradyrhizobium betae TaxID=244734 RepID=UPI00100E9ECF|nr:hypothetical protein [Bradyrhizobium betae]